MKKREIQKLIRDNKNLKSTINAQEKLLYCLYMQIECLEQHHCKISKRDSIYHKLMILAIILNVYSFIINILRGVN